jgi:autotransporter-associated beta strand protein
MTWTGSLSGPAPTSATLPSGVTGFLYTSGNTLYLQVLAQPLTWDISDTSDQAINDGNGTWNTANALWNDSTLNNANAAWDNTLNAKDTAAFGGITNGTVTVSGTNKLGGITFNLIPGTAFYTITGGGLSTTNNDTLLITNNDTGNDRRTASGATINSRLTGNMKIMFSGAGDNVVLGNTANDFVGQIQLNGGGVQISNTTQLGALSNSIEVVGTGNYLRNSAAVSIGRDILFSAGRTLQLVNGGNILTHTGAISGGDATAQLIIGAAHGPGNGNHRVRLEGTNTMYGAIRIYDQLRAYEGIGLSTNANIVMGNSYLGSVNAANASGILETSGDFIRPLGAGVGQFQWSNDGTYNCGGFSAVGAPLTISFGGLASPTALTWASTSGFIANVATAELRFQNNNSTHALTWKNPINFNNALRTVFVGASNYETTFDAVLSGTGNSGLSKTGTGSLTLAADNTYAGLTVINAGTLWVGNGGATGTLGGGTVTNNAKLVVNRSNDYNLTNLIVGTGTLLKLGSGTLTLSSTNTFSGLTTVSNGTLAAGCDLALNTGNALTLSGGTFDAGSSSNDLSSLTLSTDTASMMSVNTGTCKLSFTGLSGTGTLAITGTVGPKTLRFGIDATTLTRDQLNLIRANNRKVYLDGNGYLLIIPDGTVIRFL